MHKRFKKLGPFLSVLLLLSADCFAAHPLATDDIGTQGKGRFQLELNSEFTYEEQKTAGTTTTETGTEVATTLSAGITDDIDVVIGLPYVRAKVKTDGSVLSDESGFSDMSLEVKWRFYEKDGLGFALKPGATLPTGDGGKGLGSGEVSYGLTFIATKEIEPLALHTNLGYEHGSGEDTLSASLAAEVELTEDLKAGANIGMETGSDFSGTPPAFILAGFIYSVSEDFDIDMGLKAGLTEDENDLAALTGIAWRF